MYNIWFDILTSVYSYLPGLYNIWFDIFTSVYYYLTGLKGGYHVGFDHFPYLDYQRESDDLDLDSFPTEPS